MTQIYRDIVSLVDIEVTEEDKKAIDNYCKKLNTWKCVLIIAIIIITNVVLYGVFMEIPWLYASYLVYVVLYIFEQRFIKRQSDKFTNYMHEECDADKMLSLFMALAARAKREKGWENNLCTIILTLFYRGRFEDCKKLLPLFKKYCDNNKGAIRYTIVNMCLCYQERNAEALNKHAKVLEQLMKNTKNDYAIKSLCEQPMKYPALLELMEKGQYDAVFALLQRTDGKMTQLVKVSIQYRLYHTAKVAGLEEQAAKHKAYVLAYGGNTFYKKELEAANEAGF